MIIQFILLIGLLSVFGYAVSQRRRSRPLSALMMFTSALGGLLVLFPDWTNAVANFMGVGRGADLILYCFVLITLTAVFNLHLRLRAAMEHTTDLARAIALTSARPPSNEHQ